MLKVVDWVQLCSWSGDRRGRGKGVVDVERNLLQKRQSPEFKPLRVGISTIYKPTFKQSSFIR